MSASMSFAESSSFYPSSSSLFTFANTGAPDGPDLRRCSVRTCKQMLANNASTKMCDKCRGKHRVYATTKRARRKLEKAAVLGHTIIPVEQIPGSTAWMPGAESGNDHPGKQIGLPCDSSNDREAEDDGNREEQFPTQIQNNATTIIEPSPGFLLQHHTSPVVSHASPPLSNHPTWDPSTIDPQLYRPQSTTYELAGALTLPPSLSQPSQQQNSFPQMLTPELLHQEVTQLSESPEIALEYPSPLIDSSDQSAATQDSEVKSVQSESPPRFCSVKGCKAILAASYSFKMCEPCRDRYRAYGVTKRAKHRELKAIDSEEISTQTRLGDRAVSMEGPEAPSLRDNDKVTALSSLISANYDGIMENFPAFQSLFAGFINPQMSFDSSAQFSPQSTNDAATPSRLCTVSHCHEVLDHASRYKRCDQHRLQNRYHSQLKRVREKEVKATGPPKDAIPQYVNSHMTNVKPNRLRGSVEPSVLLCSSTDCCDLLPPDDQWDSCEHSNSLTPPISMVPGSSPNSDSSKTRTEIPQNTSIEDNAVQILTQKETTSFSLKSCDNKVAHVSEGLMPTMYVFNSNMAETRSIKTPAPMCVEPSSTSNTSGSPSTNSTSSTPAPPESILRPFPSFVSSAESFVYVPTDSVEKKRQSNGITVIRQPSEPVGPLTQPGQATILRQDGTTKKTRLKCAENMQHSSASASEQFPQFHLETPTPKLKEDSSEQPNASTAPPPPSHGAPYPYMYPFPYYGMPYAIPMPATGTNSAAAQYSQYLKYPYPYGYTPHAASPYTHTYPSYPMFIPFDTAKVQENYTQKRRKRKVLLSDDEVKEARNRIQEQRQRDAYDQTVVYNDDANSSTPLNRNGPDVNLRMCANRNCERKIPHSSSGNICERCRMRLKKHQARIKQRFKLEPKKLFRNIY